MGEGLFHLRGFGAVGGFLQKGFVFQLGGRLDRAGARRPGLRRSDRALALVGRFVSSLTGPDGEIGIAGLEVGDGGNCPRE